MAVAVVTCLSLCSGISGLERGLRLAMPGLRVVAYVEREAYAAATLLARMEDEALEPAPVWCGDLEDFDPNPFVGVDIVSAGFPLPAGLQRRPAARNRRPALALARDRPRCRRS